MNNTIQQQIDEYNQDILSRRESIKKIEEKLVKIEKALEEWEIENQKNPSGITRALIEGTKAAIDDMREDIDAYKAEIEELKSKSQDLLIQLTSESQQKEENMIADTETDIDDNKTVSTETTEQYQLTAEEADQLNAIAETAQYQLTTEEVDQLNAIAETVKKWLDTYKIVVKLNEVISEKTEQIQSGENSLETKYKVQELFLLLQAYLQDISQYNKQIDEYVSRNKLLENNLARLSSLHELIASNLSQRQQGSKLRILEEKLLKIAADSMNTKLRIYLNPELLDMSLIDRLRASSDLNLTNEEIIEEAFNAVTVQEYNNILPDDGFTNKSILSLIRPDDASLVLSAIQSSQPTGNFYLVNISKYQIMLLARYAKKEKNINIIEDLVNTILDSRFFILLEDNLARVGSLHELIASNLSQRQQESRLDQLYKKNKELFVREERMSQETDILIKKAKKIINRSR